MKPTRVPLRAIPALAAAGLAGGVVFAGLWAVSAAPGQSDRLAELRGIAAASAPPSAEPAPAAAPCRSDAAIAARDALATLRRIASVSGVTLAVLDFTPLESPQADLVGFKVDMTLRGAEGDVAGFVRAASAEQLPIFLDTADVQREPDSRIQASFTGRLLCRRGLG